MNLKRQSRKITNILFKSFYWSKFLFNDEVQLYLIFQTLYYTLKRLANTEKGMPWKSKGLLTEKVVTPTTADNSLSVSIKWYRNSNFC